MQNSELNMLHHANDQSVSQALYEAHATLHGEPNDSSRMFTLLSNLDKTVRTGFLNVETRFNNLQETLKTVTSDVNHLKGAVKIVENDLRGVKVNVIPALEKKLTDKIEELEQAKLQSELYSKKQNLLFFNIATPPATGPEDAEKTLCNHLSAVGVPNVKNLLFMNVHRLPTKSANQDRPDPIIAKFARMQDRNMILSFKPVDGIKYSVSPHLPTVMQQERRRLIPIRDKLKAEGKPAKIKVTGTKVQLLVNNVVQKTYV